MAIKKLGRFDEPGHRVTGDRRGRNRGAGWDFVHVSVDDATRLADVEVLADERRQTTTGFLLRALRWFRTQGIRAERVMTDNGSACRSRRFARALRLLAIRHIFTRPDIPRTNGKASPSQRPRTDGCAPLDIQTLLPEWADGLRSPSSAARNADLHRWLDWFDRTRPHAALNGLSPIDQMNNLMRMHR